MIDIDVIFSEIGGWGRYQQLMYLVLCVPSLAAGAAVISLSWTSYNMAYRCLIPACENATSATYDASFLQFTTPRQSSPVDPNLPWDKCYTYLATPSAGCTPEAFDRSHQVTCDTWVWDTSVMHTSVMSEFELACDRSWLSALANSLYMGGMFTGSLVIGHISDRYGRKIAMMLAFLTVAVMSTVSAFVTSFGAFAALRFLTGIGGMGIFMVTFLLAVEGISNEVRTFCAFAIHFFFASGASSVGVLAIFIKNWRYLQLVLAVPVYLLLTYWFFVPESPRWLAAEGKDDILEKNLRRAAKFNRVEFPDHLLKKASITVGESTSDLNVSKTQHTKMTVLDLFRSSSLCWRTSIILYQWFVCAMVYYGLGMNATNLGSSVYLNFVLVQAVEIPACICCIFVLDPWGRKLSLSLSFFLCGLGSIGSGLVASTEGLEALTVALAMVGKFGGSATFAIVYIYGAELFPTELRTSGIGLSSAAGRIGSISAPFIASLGTDSQVLPMSIFGVLALIGGVVTLFLPETFGQDLPDTIEETEAFGRDQSFCFVPCLIRRKERKT